MRAIWKGAVAFGLVNVPVKLYAATGEKDVALHQVHSTDGGRIRYQKVCSIDGELVEWSQIAKGYETADGQLVVLTADDLDSLPLATERAIEVLEFVPVDQVDPVLYGKAYYLEPEKTALKPYTLLREALASAARVAVVKVALRQRESLALLRVRDKVICLQTLLWPDEVRAAEFPILDEEVTVKPAELAMAGSLVEQLAADFDPDEYSDDYAAALQSVIDAKVGAGDVQAPPTEPEVSGGEVVDLLAALQRSIEAAREGRGGSASSADDGAGGGATGSDATPTATADEDVPVRRSRRKAS